MVHYLLKVTKESRVKGRVTWDLNVTFISLIPRMSKADSFSDLRTISLYNLAYKWIPKIIENKIKKGVSKGMSP